MVIAGQNMADAEPQIILKSFQPIGAGIHRAVQARANGKAALRGGKQYFFAIGQFAARHGDAGKMHMAGRQIEKGVIVNGDARGFIEAVKVPLDANISGAGRAFLKRRGKAARRVDLHKFQMIADMGRQCRTQILRCGNFRQKRHIARRCGETDTERFAGPNPFGKTQALIMRGSRAVQQK